MRLGRVIMDNGEFNREKYVAPPMDRFEEEVSAKNRFTAALLAIFLGTFGIHEFYLGYTKKGLIHLLMVMSGLLSVASTGWAIGEGIMLFCGKINKDGDGNLLL